MVARLKKLYALHAHRLQHLAQWNLKPAPMVAHRFVLIFRVAVQRIQGHKWLQRLFVGHAIVNVGKHLVHAGQL